MNLQAAREAIDAHFERRLPGFAWLPEIQNCARHVVCGAGKALRPALLMAAYQRDSGRAGTPSQATLDAALALELLHTYSLVHDDLPAMDNADLRRGRPTLHRLHGDAAAILLGDALLTAPFELLAQADLDAEARVRLVRELSRAAGGAGMVAGQWRDVLPTHKNLQGEEALAELERTHALKTGALFGAALAMGAICAGARAEQRLLELRRAGERFGYFFQMVDDVIDAMALFSAAEGKSGGRDAASGKQTYASLLGVPGALQRARQLREDLGRQHPWLDPFLQITLERIQA